MNCKTWKHIKNMSDMLENESTRIRNSCYTCWNKNMWSNNKTHNLERHGTHEEMQTCDNTNKRKNHEWCVVLKNTNVREDSVNHIKRWKAKQMIRGEHVSMGKHAWHHKSIVLEETNWRVQEKWTHNWTSTTNWKTRKNTWIEKRDTPWRTCDRDKRCSTM